jgi:adenylosuccinate lyase
MNNIWSISPIDGRYGDKVEELKNFFSEAALIKFRVLVEVEYFISLCEKLPQLFVVNPEIYPILRQRLITDLSEDDILRIKEIEKTTNHDVKAVEYFIKEVFDVAELAEVKEFIHFGLTSQDINNTAIPLMIKKFHFEYLNNLIGDLIDTLDIFARGWIKLPMLARTHGQPASPTTLGKELLVFVERLEKQLTLLNEIPHTCKFGGATGNFNAHHVAYPKIEWNLFANNFCDRLGLIRSYPTTQIEHYDNLAAYFDGLKRINVILIDFSRDMWQYISMNYFSQKKIDTEVGSSAMPHKVNPIQFENAEGNLGLSIAILEHLSTKLPVSRLQRDLTDSTVLRNVGVPIAHMVISLKSLISAINRIEVNESEIINDLEENWQVVSEGIQTILRREGYENPYEKLKEFTRGKIVTEEIIKEFISELDVSEDIKSELRNINPQNYIGL